MKQPSKLPPIDLVEMLYSYDPISGDLTRIQTGTVVGNNDRTSGYCKVRVGRLTVNASRIAWLLFYREDPVGCIIEHIDGDKKNNSISNLRKVRYRFKAKVKSP